MIESATEASDSGLSPAAEQVLEDEMLLIVVETVFINEVIDELLDFGEEKDKTYGV